MVYAVEEGLAAMVAITPNGYRRILYLYRPGQIVGARTLMPDSPESRHEAQALTDLAALAIGRRDLEEIGARHPEVVLHLTRSFSRRIEELNRRLLAVMSVEVRVRLARVLLDLSANGSERTDELVPLVWHLTHREMAQIVGASRPHVSTVLGELEEEGVVERLGQQGVLVRPARLARIVASAI